MLGAKISLAALAGLLSIGGVLAANSPGCGKASPAIKSGNYTLKVNNKDRQYIVKLPDNYDPSQPYRLIFTYHALGGSADQIANGGFGTAPYYGLPPLANNSAIFVAPNGQVNASVFNAMGWANAGGEDILFLDAMLEAIESELCVNQNLRFSAGFSYGGSMSYAIACARADKFRALGIFSGGTMSGCQGGGPSGPIATYQQHGSKDQVLNIDTMGRAVRNTLVKANGCTPLSTEPMPTTDKATKTEYAGCKAGYPFTWVIFNGDHTPTYADAGSSTPIAGPNFWNFLSQFS